MDEPPFINKIPICVMIKVIKAPMNIYNYHLCI